MMVFRMETYEGRGPYNGGAYCIAANDDLEGTHYQPAPPQDPYLADKVDRIHNDDVFGFVSLEQIFAWWSDQTIKNLEGCNFRLWVFEVDENFVMQGRHQCVFPRHLATRLFAM